MRNRVLWIGLIFAAFSTALSASTIVGTFDMTGSVTVTRTTISWNSDVFPFLSEMFTLNASTGIYTGQDGENTVDNLDNATAPVGVLFPPLTFISFDVAPSPALLINFIPAGFGGTADCTLVPAVGQTCTPPNPGGSPFTFTNTPTLSGGCCQSTAEWVFLGVIPGQHEVWFSVFSSEFNKSFQSVLAAFAPGGSGVISNDYSATVTVLSSTVPEPAPLYTATFGGGLILVGLVLRKKARRS